MEASQSFASQLKHPWSDEDGFNLEGLGEAASGSHETDLQWERKIGPLLRGLTFNLVRVYLFVATVGMTRSLLTSFARTLPVCRRGLGNCAAFGITPRLLGQPIIY